MENNKRVIWNLQDCDPANDLGVLLFNIHEIFNSTDLFCFCQIFCICKICKKI